MDRYIINFFCNVILILIIKEVPCQQIDDENICLKYPGNLVIANPIDCFSFFACPYGNAMKIICPNHSMFNPKLGNCDPDYTDCKINKNDNIQNDEFDKKELLEELLSEDMESDDEDIDNVWNAETETTDHMNSTTPDSTATEDDEDVDNVSNAETATTDHINSTTPEFSSTDSTATSISPTEDPNNCETCTQPIPLRCPPNDTESPSFLAGDLFCDSFYLCYHGMPYEMFCPVGFHWSQEHKNCIHERLSNCTDSSFANKVPKCPLNGQFFIPHSDRCNLFYYCENGVRSIQQCTAFKQWDVIEKTCKLDINARCIKTIPRSQRSKYYSL